MNLHLTFHLTINFIRHIISPCCFLLFFNMLPTPLFPKSIFSFFYYGLLLYIFMYWDWLHFNWFLPCINVFQLSFTLPPFSFMSLWAFSFILVLWSSWYLGIEDVSLPPTEDWGTGDASLCPARHHGIEGAGFEVTLLGDWGTGDAS